MSAATDFVPIARVERSGFDESFHTGAVVVLDADGEVSFASGNPDAAIYPRSCNKPLQAAAIAELDVTLSDQQWALACASHSGSARHTEVVRSILSDCGLSDGALGNTPSLPFDRTLADAVIANGGGPSPILQNCSGKHAAMLAACVAQRWPIEGYLGTEHPLQQAINERISDLTGGLLHVGIDGCGAPTHAITLRGLARAFANLAASRHTVWRAMSDHPDLVGGDHRVVTNLMRALPGMMAKDGADGVFAAAFADGRAVAIKIGDGATRAAGVVVARALQHAGELTDADPASFGEPVYGHGEPVGAIRPMF